MILGLVFLVAAIVVYIEFIEPVYQDTQELKAKELGHEKFLNSEKQAIEKIQNLISAYQGAGDLRQVVSLSFPEKEDVVGALAQIYGLAQESGLSLQLVSATAGGGIQKPAGEGKTGSPAPLKPVGISAMQMKLVGSYDNLKVFLSRLETNIRIFDLRSLTIQSNAAPAGKLVQTTYIYDLSVATYYQDQ